MTLRCGIVGLPNVGKSTLFNSLTQANVAAENYPFCTIEPNLGKVAVPDIRLEQLAAIVHPACLVPTLIEFVDIAGLVKGAAQGEGLGNQFLSHIRETDAILQVVRCFADTNILHVMDQCSPMQDISIIQTELALADLETIERIIQRIQKAAQIKQEQMLCELNLLKRLQEQLNLGSFPLHALSFNKEEQAYLSHYPLLCLKPMLFVANVSENAQTHSQLLEAVQAIAIEQHIPVIVVCATLEAELAKLDANEKKLFLAEFNLLEPGLNQLIRESYQLLNLRTYFTAGVKEVRAWTIQAGQTAPQAAGIIHTDFEKGFICAEVIAFEDFIQYQGEQGAKEAGKKRIEGRHYQVQEGDVLCFRFNV